MAPRRIAGESGVTSRSPPSPNQSSPCADAIYPIVPITDGLGLGLAVFSYAGTLHVGLNTDPGLVPDLEKLGHAIEEAFEELRARS